MQSNNCSSLHVLWACGLDNVTLNPAIFNSQGENKTVHESEKFEIADSKCLQSKFRGNGFEFEIARSSR